MQRSHNHKVAIHLATKLGLPVFSVREKDYTYTVKTSGKLRTLKAKAPYTRQGFKNATKDSNAIDAMWRENPNAAVGVPMGLHSSLLALDIDDGQGKTGEASFAVHNFELPPTVQTRTMSGGRHLFFKIPLDFPIKNSAGTVFGKHVDVRGVGGYVVWAGSEMEDGSYDYIEGCSPEDVPFAEVPEKIMDIFRSDQRKQLASITASGPVTEGSRNDSLFQASVKQVHAGLSNEAVMQNARGMNANYQPPLEDEEVERTVHSAQKYKKNDVMPFTDLGNAERLRRDVEGDLIFVKEEIRWRIFDQTRWVYDRGAADRLAHQTVRSIPYEAGPDPVALQAAIKWGKTSEANARIKAMLDVASNLDGMSASKQKFDRYKNLINFTNGTLDLRKGELREHRKREMLTAMAGCSYDSDAVAERWLAFIDEIMDGEKEDVEYLQKLTGYILWGKRPEQIVQFFMGDGGDGKSVFLETLRKLLGDYQITLPAVSLSAKNPAAIPNDVARIADARLVAVSELPKGLHVNTQLVKGISGGDTLSARFLHQEFFDFEPQALLLINTNFYPYCNFEDKAYFRRLRILRFPVNFSENGADLHLRDKLISELPGILNWAIKGFLLYCKEGLKPTLTMLDELERYRRFVDPLDGFYEANIEATNDESHFIPTDDLWEKAQKYLLFEDRAKIEKAQFINYMRLRGQERVQRRVNGERFRGYAKIRTVDYKEDTIPF